MKILFCAINSKYIHSTLAAWYLKRAVEKQDASAVVLEATINEKTDTVLAKILSCDFDAIAFSTYIWNKNMVIELAKGVKEATGKTVILGGPEVSYNAGEILSLYSFVDYVVSGEGEIPFERIVKGDNKADIEGLCYRKDCEIVVKDPYISFVDPPFPYTQDYLEALNGRITYLETSRGCPFHCAFCLSGRCGGVRFFDLEESKRKIITLANSGTQTVKFIDRTFNANKKRANQIFQFIIDEYGKKIPTSVCFHFEIEGELVDDEMIEILKTAPSGLFQFEIGLQSFNEKTLLYINRRTNLKKLTDVIQKIIALGNIHVHIDLIAGMSYEDMCSFENSFNKALALRPHMLQLGFLKLLHGAKMREDTKKYSFEYSSEPPYEVISTEWMNRQELEQLHIFEDVFEKLYNSARFPHTCEYIFSNTSNAFEMIFGFAKYCKKEKLENNLDAFTKALFEYFSAQAGFDKNRLRDMLAIDRLSTNKMGSLPEFFKVHSPLLKSTLNELEKSPQTKRKKGVKRAATLLLSEPSFVYVDYDDLDKVKKAYKVNKFFINIEQK